ncbi:MAG: hypothetical protein IJV85_02325 [Clostridia bacterium]|nr:hypothetical protein [Clostridia bacterium]
MEERIIDDEYGRGIRLKKTKDGYVDATDELAEDVSEAETENAVETDEADEIDLKFPVFAMDEDDEELVGLSPEEALALIQKREREAAERKAEYEKICKEGEELLSLRSFHAAELKYEKALQLDGIATEASVGYWRAKTADFTEPDVLIEEYAEAGAESLEYDLGTEAVEKIRQKYSDVFKKRLEELTAEETPLAEELERKTTLRREILKGRRKGSFLRLAIAAVPLIAALVFTLVFGLKISSTRTNEYVLPTIIAGSVSFVLFIVNLIFANKYINDWRMYKANERKTSTEDGQRLETIGYYKELYEFLSVNE